MPLLCFPLVGGTHVLLHRVWNQRHRESRTQAILKKLSTRLFTDYGHHLARPQSCNKCSKLRFIKRKHVLSTRHCGNRLRLQLSRVPSNCRLRNKAVQGNFTHRHTVIKGTEEQLQVRKLGKTSVQWQMTTEPRPLLWMVRKSLRTPLG
ncbi:rCG51806 [Rattus norvegicus]|uniref:RCG51806 n=1 Tax=Rattus norvegicus TaxID=10116 RepID=A6K3M7_RAT|nr:rCG51806 [Rattus norvegicus]